MSSPFIKWIKIYLPGEVVTAPALECAQCGAMTAWRSSEKGTTAFEELLGWTAYEERCMICPKCAAAFQSSKERHQAESALAITAKQSTP